MTCLTDLRWQFAGVEDLRAGDLVSASALIAATGARRRADRVREADVRCGRGPRSRDRFAGLGMLTRPRRAPRLWHLHRKRPARSS
ncbi:hypothetical protein [Lentzea sp. NPDC004782]|uniref:hypothetical protein n=1 Tax=Lentzea sp. NPDC004782 TaxID=3154458 RepID=UPI0033A77E01